MNWHALPTVNALLNGTSAILLVCGWRAIRQQRVKRHRALLLAACATSTLFLICYLTYHAHVGSVRFPGRGWVRPVYFTLLISHTILAVAIVPLVLTSLILALRRRWHAHRAVARWTMPLWLYVSVTGVIIYWMLYRIPWEMT